MNPSDKRKSEYRKMKAAFEWNDWPVPTPQSFHHWTLARQVDHLITAREAEPDLGFMVRLMALCSLPRTNGPYTLIMTATGTAKLPYGNLPRLLMAWVSTEAVRTQRRELILGRSLSEFMRKLDITSTSGGTRGERPLTRATVRQKFAVAINSISLSVQWGLSEGDGAGSSFRIRTQNEIRSTTLRATRRRRRS